MPRHSYTHPSAGSSGALTPEQVERIRVALRSAAGDHAGALELAVEELEERIAPGLGATN
jgi:hypothetical protein